MGNRFSKKSLEDDIKKALQRNDEALAVAKIQGYLEKGENIPLNIAITGESGSGKSTFVNAIRGVDNKDEEAAPTGSVETTMEVTPYPYPNFPNITVWDLPGVGTMKFPAAEYLKKVGFERFDFFVIISSDRFRENDVKLAKEIKRMKKKFYFVRSKIDNNIRDERRCQGGQLSPEWALTKIRKNCIKGLQEQGFRSPKVFLVSSFDLHLYDFSLLEQTLERKLPELKREAFLLAMPNFSMEMIEKKKAAFKSRIHYFATLSAAIAGVPVPGLSIAADLGMLVGVVTQYVFGLGLDISSLKRVANYTGVPLEELIKVIASPLAATAITPALIVKTLVQTARLPAILAVEEGSRFIPILGIPISMALSFTLTYRSLNISLDMLAEDAQNVLKAASCSNKTKAN
ncbi:interferon-gamma-inducible GTPase 10-like [Halichoeres trimaculatus]|uniref:interferon-gamma-inducible GTPase 10-like n=1 Tax=Halichoeres trimaculatus TaxID=147232 RepID=UPI003D9EC74B